MITTAHFANLLDGYEPGLGKFFLSAGREERSVFGRRVRVTSRTVDRDVFVYIATSPCGAVKIGQTWSPYIRLINLRSVSRRDRLLGGGVAIGEPSYAGVIAGCKKAHEKALHAAFAHEAIGGEWFRGPAVSGLARLLTQRSEAA